MEEIKVWRGTEDEFVEAGRFLVVDDNDLLAIDGRLVVKVRSFKKVKLGCSQRELVMGVRPGVVFVWE